MSELAFIALGSNTGDSHTTLRAALRELANLSQSPLLVSSLWITAPVDCPPGSGDFYNAAAGLKPPPGETPETLLDKLLALETKFGRARKLVLNEPRPLDLDLIAFRLEQRNTPNLMLPHPRASQRSFVLAPLNEIAPDLILPGKTKTIRELLLATGMREIIARLAI